MNDNDAWRQMERRILRERQRELMDALDRLDLAPQGAAAEVVQVFQQVAIPGANKKYFACHPATPGGVEVAGGAVSLSADSGTVFVGVVGDRVPVAGDYLIAEPVGGRWVAECRRSTATHNPCGGASNFIRLTLRGCNNCVVPGATVDFIRNGIVLFSTTTNSSGIAQFNNPPPGAYTINWSITAQGHLYSGSISSVFTVITSSCNSVSVGANIAPPAPPGYTCYTAYPFPLPPLFVTDAAGTRPHGACVVHGGISMRTSIVPGGTCAAPTLSTGHEWVDGGGPSCNCTTLMTYGGSGCAFAPGCGNVFGGGGSFDPAPYVDPFTFSGSYGPAHLVGCGGNTSTTPVSGGFTIHT